MKKIAVIITSLVLVGGILFSACEDMMKTETGYIDAGDNELNSANDTLYSLAGILRNLQRIGDRYVILGELRGDLMDISENADLDLQEISNFMTAENFEKRAEEKNPNPWVSVAEYYAVINNCNYYISRADTNVITGGAKPILKEYAAVKAIRAWTYLQIVLNYGKATYFTEPLLSIQDMNKTYPEYDLAQLAPILIDDIKDYEHLMGDVTYEYPNYGSAGTTTQHELSYFFVPVSFILGDLYLWNGQYDLAMQKYYNLIRARYASSNPVFKSSVVPARYVNYWTTANFDRISDSWSDMNFRAYRDVISALSYNNSEPNTVTSVLLNYTVPTIYLDNAEYKLIPSEVAMDNWDKTLYIHYDKTNDRIVPILQDLRGNIETRYGLNFFSSNPGGSYLYCYTSETDSVPMITKYVYGFYNNSVNLYLYRGATLYLRLAEALNRSGRPSLAFAVLKYGLLPDITSNSAYVNPEELQGVSLLNFDFVEDVFVNRDEDTDRRSFGGIHERGGGLVSKDSTYYVLPRGESVTKEDSIFSVDNYILKELALETAFEGNRFHDLMRFATLTNRPDYVANYVGLKNPNVKAKLMDPKNWYLPLPKE